MKKMSYILLVGIVCAASHLISQEMVTSRQLTSDPSREGFPSWSPDGKIIIYMFVEMIDGKPVFGSKKISSAGGTPTPFTDFPTEHPQWSPDGRFIVFDADTGASMALIDANGGSQKHFMPHAIRIHNGGLPCWSPSGSHIAFKDSAGALFVYDLEAGTFAEIFRREGMIALPGCWSRDGGSILVTLTDRKTRLSTIWRILSDGREKKQITGHRDSLYRYLALSPDGSLLVYAAMQGKRLGLWIMFAEGGKSLPLAVSDQYHNESPAWSPDGKRIAFASGRTGRGDIYLMELDVERIRKELHSLNQ